MKVKIVLTLEVDFETNGEAVTHLKNRLFYAVRNAYESGHFTGDSGAEIEEMKILVDYQP